ncbi:hypothetical protein [Mycolicibacterium sediminis]|uniref:Lipoprotein LpqB n=1 Tax=Mycolicibacterium sediminis TaxID=1286180 RepID=A0A7I7QKU2_9MYCO|nr:hypothetical protein [Mycolicibacterium sediminis]BBY26720.1 hypothetical protein MSEDJ_08160 [Mycolicibacterium sediminis]
MSVVLALSVVLAAGCDTPPGTPPPTLPTLPTAPTTSASPEPAGPQLAYRAAGEIGLVDGTEVVASAPGTFAPSSDPVITEDGRFVFGHTGDGDVVAIEVATRKTSTVAMPPGVRVGTAEGSVLVWLEQPGRLMQIDLADPAAGPAMRRQVDLPPVDGATPPRLLAARGGTAVLAREESGVGDGGPETLYAVRGTAPPASLGTAEADTPVATAALSADGSRLAYGLFRPAGTDCGNAAVVVTAADGSQQTFDVSTPDPATGSRVTHMWWPRDRPMELSLATWRCDPISYYSPLVWEFADGNLVEAKPRTVALQAADVAPGQRALIIPQGGASAATSGTLILEDSGRRLPIKTDVDAVDVIPAP